jgi:catechol 2,3-dioxygenase-like lactoylglutathione lyase family enzyme
MLMIDRRRALKYSAAALMVAAAKPSFAAPPVAPAVPSSFAKAEATATNPFAARAYIFTVVTPDMEASLHFYRDIVGYDLIDRGKLDGHLPTVAGVGEAGREYALLRHNQKIVGEEGVIRLMQAPRGAKENRPRPLSKITDPGWATIEGHPSDWQAAYHRMAKNNIRTISGPLYYWYAGQPDDPPPKGYSVTYSAFGPAGEQMFISAHPAIVPNYTGIYGPLFRHTLMALDRWPVIDFYDKALGLKASDAIYVGPETLNYKSVDLLAGAPADAYYGVIDLDLPNEIWEWRQWDPQTAPTWPTSLDRTGLAVITVIVDNLAAARSRVQTNAIAIIGEGALPSIESKTRDGFYIRGAVGELIEVIGRA